VAVLASCLPTTIGPLVVLLQFKSFILSKLLMSRDPRSNRAGAGGYAPATRQYEEYEDDYHPTSRYYSQEPAPSSGRGGNRPAYGGASTTSSSSGGGSLLDRMKVKSYDTSSRTSIDEDYDNKPRQPSAATWARKPGATRQQIPEERREGMLLSLLNIDGLACLHRPVVARAPAPAQAQAPDPGSAGSTLWGRVVGAAGSLTINVTGAWTSGASDGPGMLAAFSACECAFISHGFYRHTTRRRDKTHKSNETILH